MENKDIKEIAEAANDFAKFQTAVTNSFNYIYRYRQVDRELHKKVVDEYADLFAKNGNPNNNRFVNFYVDSANLMAISYELHTRLPIISDEAIRKLLIERIQEQLNSRR